MPFPATAYRVMIASPSDVQEERNAIREIVHEWNVMHAASRGVVLLPTGWETHSTPLFGDRPQSAINWQVLKDADLLIATFWTRLGTSTGKYASGTVEEIEEHIATKKPALLYFSRRPVDLDNLDADQHAALKSFRVNCIERGLYRTYETLEEFRNLVRNHLTMTLNNDPFFNEIIHPAESVAEELPVKLSNEALQLLKAAIKTDSMIQIWDALDGARVQVGNQIFGHLDSRSTALWQNAVQELLTAGAVTDRGCAGEYFEVTKQGLQFANGSV